MEENEISYKIRGSIYDVYNAFGPGLLESVYVNALLFDLQEQGLRVRREAAIPVIFKNKILEVGYRMDLLVEEKVIIEVKSIEALAAVHHKQVLTYLKLTGLKLAILVNFNVDDINLGIVRKVNHL